ncbi:10881_t:CDS:1 [Cetraspora pellucida]|uniref:10881_t:CDS:1 n=1 Tax=Cetraspora pellucida TaxID=1433469 RepID=A0ACA9ML08_9GLOM|nr:10881_t:CDS:1 [Cetraspora pellucida]
MSFQKETTEAIKLHKTGFPENRLKAFKIFEENKNYFWLGYYHQYGYANLEIDEEKACNYYELAFYEDNNNADVSYRLAHLKLKKINTITDENERKKSKNFITSLLKMAADLYHHDACFQYGDILVNGKLGNEKDIETGKKYLERVKNGKYYERAVNLLNKINNS